VCALKFEEAPYLWNEPYGYQSPADKAQEFFPVQDKPPTVSFSEQRDPKTRHYNRLKRNGGSNLLICTIGNIVQLASASHRSKTFHRKVQPYLSREEFVMVILPTCIGDATFS